MTQNNDMMAVAFPRQHMVELNVTYNGHNGNLPDRVNFEAAPEQVKMWATEAVAQGTIPVIPATPGANFTDFTVDRIYDVNGVPTRLMLRPKTAYGAAR